MRDSDMTSVSVTRRDEEITTKGRKLEGLVVGEPRQGNYVVPVSVAVVEDDYLPSNIPGDKEFTQHEIANALVEYDVTATTPDRLLDCLDEAAKD